MPDQYSDTAAALVIAQLQRIFDIMLRTPLVCHARSGFAATRRGAETPVSASSEELAMIRLSRRFKA